LRRSLPVPRLTNRQVLLKRYPVGPPTEQDFELVERGVPSPEDGQVVCRTIYLSLDPYMRGRIRPGPSYAATARLGEVMVGGTVSQVVESRHPAFATGDIVLGHAGWQEYDVSDAARLEKLDPRAGPISYALGVLGMPGMTAYFALLDIGRPKPGETVVVSAASGAVGSVACQIARLKGCRVVGIAGSAEKCRYVVEELGADACLNHRTEDLRAGLGRACPEGIDVYFDNVAGPVLDAVLDHLNLHARIPLVGLVSQYNAEALPPGPNLSRLLAKRSLIQGFLVGDYAERRGEFQSDMGAWVREGKVRYREDVVEGLENAPAAFIGLLEGRNFGKLLVRMSGGAEPSGTG
jgi:NADPH-dependent curcumin reductase